MRPSIARFALTAPFLALALSACGDTREVDPRNPNEPSEITPPIADYDRVTPSADQLPPSGADPADCNADLARPFIGEQDSAQTRGQLLSAVAPIVNVRWLGPNDVKTQDFQIDRLNVSLDENGMITQLACG